MPLSPQVQNRQLVVAPSSRPGMRERVFAAAHADKARREQRQEPETSKMRDNSPELVAAYRVAVASSGVGASKPAPRSPVVSATLDALRNSGEVLRGELLLLRQPATGGLAAVVSRPVAHRLRRSGKMRHADRCTRPLSVAGTTVDVIEATDFASLVIKGNPRWCSLLLEDDSQPRALYKSESWRALLRAAPSAAVLAGAPMLHTSAYWARLVQNRVAPP